MPFCNVDYGLESRYASSRMRLSGVYKKCIGVCAGGDPDRAGECVVAVFCVDSRFGCARAVGEFQAEIGISDCVVVVCGGYSVGKVF